MEEKIENFWKFIIDQQDHYLHGLKRENKNFLLNPLLDKELQIISKNLKAIILNDNHPKIVFITKGNSYLKNVAFQIIQRIPKRIYLKPQIGIPPYPGNFQALNSSYSFLNQKNPIFQIYFSVHKIYPSSGKFHLNIFMSSYNKTIKKEQHNALKIILLLFLGDDRFYKRISTWKIYLRNYKKLNFIPIDQLKHLLLSPYLNH